MPATPDTKPHRLLALGGVEPLADGREALGRVLDPHRDEHPRRGEGVAAGRAVLAGAHRHRDAQLVDRLAHLAVVGAGAAGRAGDEEVVEAPAQLLGGRLGLLDRHLEHLDAPPQRALRSTPASGPGRTPRTWRMADCPSSTSSPASADDLARVAQEAEAALGGAPRDAEAAAQLVGERVDGGLDEAGVDRRRGTGRSGAIGSVASRAMSMNCSDMRMLPSPSAMAWWSFWIMAARPSSRPSTMRNSHSGRVRSNGVPTNVAVRSSSWRIDPGFGQRRPAQVVVEVEVGLVAPLRRGQPPERGDHPLAQAGHLHRGPLEPGAEPLGVGGLVEQGDVGDRRAEVRILLEVPHQRLDVGHPPLVAHLSGSSHAAEG